MNSSKIRHLSAQMGQRIFNAGRISVFDKSAMLSPRKEGWNQQASAREYTLPSSPGSGAGKGGGPGGSIRESGGALGQFGAAQEEEFFYHKRREQLEKIKSQLKKEEPKSPQTSQK